MSVCRKVDSVVDILMLAKKADAEISTYSSRITFKTVESFDNEILSSKDIIKIIITDALSWGYITDAGARKISYLLNYIILLETKRDKMIEKIFL